MNLWSSDSSGTAYTFLFGPRFSYRNSTRFTPFAQVLVGGVHASDVTISGCTGTGCTPLPAQTALAMTVGGGLDIRLTRHFSIRAVQAEYLMTRFADVAVWIHRCGHYAERSSSLFGTPHRLRRSAAPASATRLHRAAGQRLSLAIR